VVFAGQHSIDQPPVLKGDAKLKGKEGREEIQKLAEENRTKSRVQTDSTPHPPAPPCPPPPIAPSGSCHKSPSPAHSSSPPQTHQTPAPTPALPRRSARRAGGCSLRPSRLPCPCSRACMSCPVGVGGLLVSGMVARDMACSFRGKQHRCSGCSCREEEEEGGVGMGQGREGEGGREAKTRFSNTLA
jgi:hypothetical protein